MAIVDSFLDWCHNHRAPDTYEWYRYGIQPPVKKAEQIVSDLSPKASEFSTVIRDPLWKVEQGHGIHAFAAKQTG